MVNRKQYFQWVVIILLPVLALTSCMQQSNTPSVSIGTGEVSKVTIVDTVEASGSISPLQLETVYWGTNGTVASVNAQAGQTVASGDVLMSLDPSTTSNNLITAQSQLQDARQSLEQLTNPDSLSISTATQNLVSAFTALQQAQNNLNNALVSYQGFGDSTLYYYWQESIYTLKENQDAFPLVNASIDVQAYYEAVFVTLHLKAAAETAQAIVNSHPDDAILAQKAANLQAAYEASQRQQEALQTGLDSGTIEQVANLVNALSAYEQTAIDFIGSVSGALSAYEVAIKLNTYLTAFQAAELKLDDAIVNLYQLLRAPNPDDYAKAQTNLQVAQTNLQVAQNTADNMNLRAPFDGEILDVYNQPGDVVNSNTAAVMIVDRTTLYITVQVEESNAIKLHVGDTATIVVEVLPDLSLTGQVTYISAIGTANQGVMYYDVRVQLDQSDPQILLYATADVTIQVGQPQEGLVVPVTAVQSDAQGEYVNRIAADGSYERVTVVSGQILADDTVVVVGDLQVGDKVELVQQVTFSNNEGGFGGRGGGVIVGP